MPGYGEQKPFSQSHTRSDNKSKCQSHAKSDERAIGGSHCRTNRSADRGPDKCNGGANGRANSVCRHGYERYPVCGGS